MRRRFTTQTVSLNYLKWSIASLLLYSFLGILWFLSHWTRFLLCFSSYNKYVCLIVIIKQLCLKYLYVTTLIIFLFSDLGLVWWGNISKTCWTRTRTRGSWSEMNSSQMIGGTTGKTKNPILNDSDSVGQ